MKQVDAVKVDGKQVAKVEAIPLEEPHDFTQDRRNQRKQFKKSFELGLQRSMYALNQDGVKESLEESRNDFSLGDTVQVKPRATIGKREAKEKEKPLRTVSLVKIGGKFFFSIGIYSVNNVYQLL